MSTRRDFIKTASLGPLVVPEIEFGKKKVRLSGGEVILFQGDSITDARRKKDDKEPNSSPALGVSYPFFAAGELLYRAPEKDFKIYNRAISGNKVYQLADRWDVDCLDLKPTVLSILVGVNDFWHTLVNGYKGTVQTYRDDYKKLLDRTKKSLPSVKLVIGEPYAVKGVKAVDGRWYPGFPEYQQAAREIADEYGAAFIPYQEVYDKAMKSAPGSYWTADGVHPTMAGAKLMAEAWMKVVSFLLVLVFGVGIVRAQDGVHYSGTTISNVDYHHGRAGAGGGRA
ncbi:SGNH/GDSL hydrolase family protein [Puia sp. P3]|uniref:SGNH/GDSL hydrolase family protein n=1 Tax=Puia sp. P3 TaxID=3423952 RepID=UPI003D66E832